MFSKTLILFIVYSFCLPSIASFSEFSSNLKKKPNKRYKGGIKTTYIPKQLRINSKSPPLKTAVLWQAPPYKALASKLNPQEEMLRDLQALEILLEGAEENFPQIKKAKKILSKKESLMHVLSKVLISQINYMTINLDLSQFDKVRSQEQAYELINRVNKYLFANLQIYKESFFIHASRNQSSNQKVNHARNNLVLISGENTLKKIGELYTRSPKNA